MAESSAAADGLERKLATILSADSRGVQHGFLAGAKTQVGRGVTSSPNALVGLM
jgi:hypothetical protein